MENLHDKRKVYDKSQLSENEIEKNPMAQFKKWFAEASRLADETEIFEANAMSVSTVEADGCPRTRIILLKSYDENGFVFYTNYNSKKGKSLEQNHCACLHFFWASLERQVIIKAKLEKVSEEMSDEYFQSRPEGSQIGAAVSPQSEVIPNREFLENKLKELEEKYKDSGVVPRPKHWGGYLAKPYEIEFWQGRPNRLHDRILYWLENSVWKIYRLAP
ncbi:MAG: pyridoxamine 5'-phosphate oxidase [Flavobacteriaceae bacterium]|jgi:pyridoxamine 5'-phosphate oxidase|nr:pyridoxamine 5'-phosphate oxidase [Flavobacteriaceae bacterium]